MHGPAPALRDCRAPVHRAREAARDRRDGVRVAAEVDRGAQGVLVGGGRPQGPDGGGEAGPDGAVELGGPVGVPVGGEDDGVALPVVGVDGAEGLLDGVQRVLAVQCDADQLVEDGGAFPGRAVPVGERGDAAGGVHRGLASRAREVHGGGRGTHQRTVPCAPLTRLEVQGCGQVPGVAAGQHGLGLQADVLRVRGGPAPEPREHVREPEPAALQQGLRDEYGHLRVVGRLARLPAPAPAHLTALAGHREAGGENALGTELEGRAERVADGGAEDGAQGVFLPGRAVLLGGAVHQDRAAPGCSRTHPSHADAIMSWTSCLAFQPSSVVMRSAEATTRAGSPGRRGWTVGGRS